MGKSYKEGRSGHGKPNKTHPHPDSRFYKDEFHERKGGKPHKHKNRGKVKELDGFDLMG